MVNGCVRHADPACFDSDMDGCAFPPMNGTDRRPLTNTHAGSRLNAPVRTGLPNDQLKWSPRTVTRDRLKSRASERRLGVDGVTLDESRNWKCYGGMWQVKRKASGL